MEFVIFGIERRKKRNSLNMVPMVMGHKNVCFGGPIFAWRRPSASQHAQPSPTIQNELRTIRRGKLQAGRVSPIARRGRIYGRRRSSHTPEIQLSNGSRHL